jgi:hypothetical protein
MQEPNSLATTILKAKYFPHSSFLEALLRTKPSFAWRSIYNARELLSKGLLWRVGDGRLIKFGVKKGCQPPNLFSSIYS